MSMNKTSERAICHKTSLPEKEKVRKVQEKSTKSCFSLGALAKEPSHDSYQDHTKKLNSYHKRQGISTKNLKRKSRIHFLGASRK